MLMRFAGLVPSVRGLRHQRMVFILGGIVFACLLFAGPVRAFATMINTGQAQDNFSPEGYEVTREEYKGIEIRIYLFPEDRDLSGRYIKYTKEYLSLYTSMLGPFPYPSLTIAELREDAGYASPGRIVFGARVLRLPFIVETSLGHEILHQWFGNYVSVKDGEGNWSEGLTTYLSDHWYKELKGEGSEYRKKVLVDYANYVEGENEIPLSRFKQRTDHASSAVGYGKAAMLFHLIRQELGDDAFFAGLRRFTDEFGSKKAGWRDLLMALFKDDGKRVDQFIKEWIDTTGLVSLRVSDPGVVFRKGRYLLRMDIIQEEGPYHLALPVRVVFEDGEFEFSQSLSGKVTRLEQAFEKRPLKVVIDGNYDIPRRLRDDETPPVISAFIERKDTMVVVPDGEREKYSSLIEYYREKGFEIWKEDELKMDDLPGHTILLLSRTNRFVRKLFASEALPEGGFIVRCFRNPFDRKRVIVLIDGKTGEEIGAAFRKVEHYGNYSVLAFEEGRNILKETDDTSRGMVIDLGFETEVVETEKSLSLESLVERLLDRRVIYIGEAHTEYGHHLMQYEIIRRLHERDKRLIIGMEMFQRPFQEYLDRFVQGGITEEEMLRKTEYFDRWSYDYNLYRDILEYAKANSIRVVALNARKEIIEKVSEGGITALSEDEFKELPEEMDMTNAVYRKRLNEVYQRHNLGGRKDFENFYQSQLIWDETMAETVAETLRENPGYRMVVLAGNGHVEYSWGIPDRVKRRIDVPSAVIVNDGGEDVRRDLADFILFPDRVETPAAPKLQVFLDETADGLNVKGLIKGGPADKGGLRKGDIIVSIDGREIRKLSDLKILLLYHKKGDRIMVKVRRRILLIGEEKTLEVEL